MLAVHGLRSRSVPMQWLSRAVLGTALAVIAVAVAVLGTIERVYLVSADTYPRGSRRANSATWTTPSNEGVRALAAPQHAGTTADRPGR
ncbi:hypothetical protein D8B34_27110 [Verminephrobacter eiseniae]|uniref:hypothetical protein n=1 Tax=Verminephrobacter eiseniae TaxID=364317 RepID=UPI002237E838|nr:hypothetical protein [Verminephrobacter eiseniae]MCW5230821.1 hypothetical protein [Verminephrobacter eiseniae]MCW8183817.1 hypothetical protein [Verminephrobacter eiseniae]MCW8226363.1 hypothetical protein [Verminephrobacter eiseniae]MCW8237208.1 hypothetical protein [Verminephrobacter eiseniae]